MPQILLLFSTLLLLVSCKKTEHCPAFPSEVAESWIPQDVGNTIIFHNDDGSKKIEIEVLNKDLSTAESFQYRLGWNAKRQYCPPKYAIMLAAQADPAPYELFMQFGEKINTVHNYHEYPTFTGFQYRLNDFSGSLTIVPEIAVDNQVASNLFEADSILTELKLGQKIYQYVIVQSRPDTATHYQIRKVYLSENYGILGFVDSSGQRFWQY